MKGRICSSCHNGRMTAFNSNSSQCSFCGVRKSKGKVIGYGGYGS
jgi:hypothetical protein